MKLIYSPADSSEVLRGSTAFHIRLTSWLFPFRYVLCTHSQMRHIKDLISISNLTWHTSSQASISNAHLKLSFSIDSSSYTTSGPPHLGNGLISDLRKSSASHFSQHITWAETVTKDTMAQELKAKGNQLFKEGDYVGAEEYFSQA